MKLNSTIGLCYVEVIDGFKREFSCKVVIKMPGDSRLREVWKKKSWKSNFKSFDIKEETPKERMGSNEGFFPFLSFSFKMNDTKMFLCWWKWCSREGKNDDAEEYFWFLEK